MCDLCTPGMLYVEIDAILSETNKHTTYRFSYCLSLFIHLLSLITWYGIGYEGQHIIMRPVAISTRGDQNVLQLNMAHK